MISARTALLLASGATAVAILGATFFARRPRRKPSSVIPKAFFTEILSGVSKRLFEILFEYAQMAARVDAASGHREPFMKTSKIRLNDPYLREALSAAQSRILTECGIDETTLADSQSVYESDPSVAALVKVIPDMFDAYTEGRFPELPESLLARPDLTDEELLKNIQDTFDHKLGNSDTLPGLEDSIEIKNLIAARINASESFRQGLFGIVMQAQSDLRSTLS
jgi:hypothetical protein